jgi:sugar lactone lactonase YvrE
VRDAAVRQVGEPVGAVTPTTSPGWLLAAGDGFRSLTPDGRVSSLLRLRREDGGPMRMCAGACDRAGRFFAGAAAPGDKAGAGLLYRVDVDGVVSVAHAGLSVLTGIGWSPDDDVVYLADAAAGTVTAVDYDVDLGTLGRARMVLDLDEGCMPHGLTVDLAGHLWAALSGAGEVRRYGPGGVLEQVVMLRATRATGCAFAGAGLDVLVVTTSAEGLSAAEQMVQPDAGRLFTVRVADVVGRPPVAYRGPLRTLTRA